MHERAAQFVERAREEHGLDLDVEEFPEGTKTAADAADALGCDAAQIASSIVFAVDGGVALADDAAALVDDRAEFDRTDLVVAITSGANRVSERKLADLLGVDGAAVAPADADAIRGALGWSIGGVPPICHDAAVPVYLDETLLAHDTVWAAAGTPEAVFPIDPERLRELTGAPAVDLAE